MVAEGETGCQLLLVGALSGRPEMKPTQGRISDLAKLSERPLSLPARRPRRPGEGGPVVDSWRGVMALAVGVGVGRCCLRRSGLARDGISGLVAVSEAMMR